MLGLRQVLVFTTLLTSAFVSAAPQNHDDSIVDWNRLSSIIDDVDSNVLHNVLHNLSPKFRDGVFSKDRAAIEHVHSENPVVASKLVYIAKRQNNGTAAAAVATSRSATALAAVAPTISDAVSSLITASTLPAPTTIEVAPSTAPGEVAIATVAGGVVFSTEGGGVVTRTSSAVNVRFTRSTSTRTYYSTAADGSVATSTSLVVVNAPVTEVAAATGAAGAAQTSGDPGLQNAAARSSPEDVFLGMLGAALVGVVGLFAAL